MIDPIILQILQQAFSGQNAMPKYSTRHGYLPHDIGSLAQNLNYQQDYMGTLGQDPLMAALSGYIDNSAYDPVEQKQPDAPDTPLLSLYGDSEDEVMQAVIAGLGIGLRPDQIIRKLRDEKKISSASRMGGSDDDEGKHLMSVAEKLQLEMAARRQYDQATQQPQFEDSSAAKAWQEKYPGLPMPNARYEPEHFVRELPRVEQNAQRMQQGSRSARREHNASKESGWTVDAQIPTGSARATRRSSDDEIRRQSVEASRAMSDARVARREAERAASRAPSYGHTPLRNVILGRAGL